MCLSQRQTAVPRLYSSCILIPIYVFLFIYFFKSCLLFSETTNLIFSSSHRTCKKKWPVMSETGASLMIYHLHVEKYFCLLCQFSAFIFLTVIFLLFPLCVWMDGGSHSCRWWSSWSDRWSFRHFREGVWHFVPKTSSVCPWWGSSRGRRSWRGTDILCVSQGMVKSTSTTRDKCHAFVRHLCEQQPNDR